MPSRKKRTADVILRCLPVRRVTYMDESGDSKSRYCLSVRREWSFLYVSSKRKIKSMNITGDTSSPKEGGHYSIMTSRKQRAASYSVFS